MTARIYVNLPEGIPKPPRSKLPEELELRRLSSFLGSAFALLQAEVAQADLQVGEPTRRPVMPWSRFVKGAFRSHGTPIAGWFIMENPKIKWMIQGYPHLGNLHIISYIYI